MLSTMSQPILEVVETCPEQSVDIPMLVVLFNFHQKSLAELLPVRLGFKLIKIIQ